MLEETETIDATELFPIPKLHSTNKEENDLLERLEVQKKRVELTNNFPREVGIRILESTKNDLKIIYKDSKKFTHIRKMIKSFYKDTVISKMKELSEDEIITDIDDPRFNFYPIFSDEEVKEEDEIVNNDTVEKKKWDSYELIEIINIKEDQKGITFEDIFTKKRVGPNVSQVLIEDPYLHTKEQIRVLYQFILAMRFTFGEFSQIKVRTKKPSGVSTIYSHFREKYPNYTKDQILEIEHNMVVKNLTYLKVQCNKKNIDFDYSFEQHMHDRVILFNSGKMATLGRGLSIYRMHSYKNALPWNTLPCKECRIQIFCLKGFDVGRHDIFNISV
uniref:MIT_C domain-containing protein n=1 Tax=Strongyloides stercoralis TaxID=6248 RepID=A0A0K0DZM3_STRER